VQGLTCWKAYPEMIVHLWIWGGQVFVATVAWFEPESGINKPLKPGPRA
jgi:hypothetical protein